MMPPPYAPRTCQTCGGAKGQTQSTTQTVIVNGKPVTKIVRNWVPCRGCGGRGVQ